MKKAKTGKTGQHSQKQIDANSRKLLKTTCDQLLGEGYFDNFSPICQAKLICNRFPALKLKPLPDSKITTSDAKIFNEIFVSQLRSLKVISLTGEQVPLNIFLREAVLLVCYVETLEDQTLPNYQMLRDAIAPYNRSLFMSPLYELAQLLYRLTILLSDWSQTLLRHSITDTAYFSGDGTLNEVKHINVQTGSASINHPFLKYYGVVGGPWLLLIDADGNIRFSSSGAGGIPPEQMAPKIDAALKATSTN